MLFKISFKSEKLKEILFLLLPLLFVTSLPYITINEIFFYVSENYFLFLPAGLLISLSSILWLRAKEFIKLTYVDIFVIAFFGYSLGNSSVYFNEFSRNSILETILFVFIYLTVRRLYSKSISIKGFTAIFMAVGAIEISTGYLQLFGLIDNALPMMKFGGSFANPAPFSLFLVCTVPLVVHVLLNNKDLSILYKYSSIIYILLTFVIIGIAQTRSAWIGLVVGLAVVLFHRFPIISHINKLKTRTKAFVTVGLLIIITVSGLLLFNMKTESATGRIFVWENSIAAVVENPVWGTGPGSFMHSYNIAQSEAVNQGGLSESEFLQADEIKMAYNDLLQIAMELGIVGALLFLGMILFSVIPLFRKQKINNGDYIPFVAIVLVVFIAGITSYPFTILRIKTLFIIAIAICAFQVKSVFAIEIRRAHYLNYIIVPLMFTGFVTLSYKTVRHINCFNQWKDKVTLLQDGKGFDFDKDVEVIYTELKHNPLFRYNYLSVMVSQGEKKVVRSEIKKLDKHFNGYNYSMMKGRYFMNIGNLVQAQKQFKSAIGLVPSRFIPRYNLLICYDRLGKPAEAIEIANEILEMPIKMYDERVENIQNAAKSYLGKTN